MEPRDMVNYYQRVAGLCPNQGSTKKCQMQVSKVFYRIATPVCLLCFSFLDENIYRIIVINSTLVL